MLIGADTPKCYNQEFVIGNHQLSAIAAYKTYKVGAMLPKNIFNTNPNCKQTLRKKYLKNKNFIVLIKSINTRTGLAAYSSRFGQYIYYIFILILTITPF